MYPSGQALPGVLFKNEKSSTHHMNTHPKLHSDKSDDERSSTGRPWWAMRRLLSVCGSWLLAGRRVGLVKAMQERGSDVLLCLLVQLPLWCVFYVYFRNLILFTRMPTHGFSAACWLIVSGRISSTICEGGH